MSLNRIEHKGLREIEGETEIYILSDLHLGDKLVDMDRLEAFMKELEEKENRYLIINGDIMNMAVRHSVSDIYEEILNPNQAINMVVDILDPVKDKIIAMRDGNHEQRVYRTDGIIVMERIARELFGKEGYRSVYSKGNYLLELEMAEGMKYSLYGTHGAGGGRTIGSKANNLKRLDEIVVADIYLHSHTHLPMAFRKGTFISLGEGVKGLEFREQLYVNTNAFLNFGGYGEEMGFFPMSTIYPKIILDGKEKKARALI